MRLYRLARIAAEAEGVRLRGMVQRMVVRIVCAVIALVFVIGALSFAHLAAWYWLRVNISWSFFAATGALGGADLFLALVLLIIASRSKPSKVEREALVVRRQAIQGMSTPMGFARMLLPMLPRAVNLGRRRRR